ncbi:MAG TPA: BON domain-containing protein [Thermoanaerobaculia bacterium]|nr:BON domain-containing protein [Thermoanaerobaculia bacterium]
MNAKNKMASALLAAALIVPVASVAGEPVPNAEHYASASVQQAEQQLAELGIVDLKFIPIEGIVIVRGKVRDRATWEAVEARLNTLGFSRVANLTRIVPLPSDEVLTSLAERQLSLARGLYGSNLRVATRLGVVTIEGTVQNQAQADAAANLVRRIDGVRDVRIVASNI